MLPQTPAANAPLLSSSARAKRKVAMSYSVHGSPMPTPTHDLRETYLHLSAEERAPAMPGGDSFWGQLMSGNFTDPRVEAVADGGWLVTRFTHTGDWPHWERHPHGDEVLVCLSGSVRFLLEHEDGRQETVDLREGRTLVMPAGAWHRGLGEGPAEILAITAGRGTDHRPAEGG